MTWAWINYLLPKRSRLKVCGRDRRGPLVSAQVSLYQFLPPTIPVYIKKKSRSTARNPQHRSQSKLFTSHLYILAFENAKYTCLVRDIWIKICCLDFQSVSCWKSHLTRRWSFLDYLFNWMKWYYLLHILLTYWHCKDLFFHPVPK